MLGGETAHTTHVAAAFATQRKEAGKVGLRLREWSGGRPSHSLLEKGERKGGILESRDAVELEHAKRRRRRRTARQERENAFRVAQGTERERREKWRNGWRRLGGGGGISRRGGELLSNEGQRRKTEGKMAFWDIKEDLLCCFIGRGREELLRVQYCDQCNFTVIGVRRRKEVVTIYWSWTAGARFLVSLHIPLQASLS